MIKLIICLSFYLTYLSSSSHTSRIDCSPERRRLCLCWPNWQTIITRCWCGSAKSCVSRACLRQWHLSGSGNSKQLALQGLQDHSSLPTTPLICSSDLLFNFMFSDVVYADTTIKTTALFPYINASKTQSAHEVSHSKNCISNFFAKSWR